MHFIVRSSGRFRRIFVVLHRFGRGVRLMGNSHHMPNPNHSTSVVPAFVVFQILRRTTCSVWSCSERSFVDGRGDTGVVRRRSSLRNHFIVLLCFGLCTWSIFNVFVVGCARYSNLLFFGAYPAELNNSAEFCICPL